MCCSIVERHDVIMFYKQSQLLAVNMITADVIAKQKIQSGYVYIIESFVPSELTNDISEGKAIQAALNLIGISSVYKPVVDRDSFEKAIRDDLMSRLRTSELNPIVHISAHDMPAEYDSGTTVNRFHSRGIVLANGDGIRWDELKKYLVDINDILNGKLVVCMSSCYGYAGLLTLFTRSRKAFFALIANTGSYDRCEFGIAFATFYHQLFRKSASLDEAVKKMAVSSGNADFRLIATQNPWASWTDINKRSQRERHCR